MRTRLCIIFFFLLGKSIIAQNYGNEWINYQQQYFKFSVHREGIYRIDSTTLSKYFNLGLVNPKNFQVFIKGQEQFIYVAGESDNKVNTGDFIEFYSDGRPGDIDSAIYYKIAWLPNRYQPMFNDSLFAFITLNNSQNNKRFATETDVNYSAYPAANYFYKEWLIKTNRSYYNQVFDVDQINNNSNPLYTQAEGRGERYTSKIPFNSPALNSYTASSNLPGYFSYHASGFSISPQAYDHRLQVSYSDAAANDIILRDTTFSGYVPLAETFTIPSQNLGNTTTLKFGPVPLSGPYHNAANRIDLHYMSLLYPSQLNLNGDSLVKLRLDDAGSSAKTYFDFQNFNAGNPANVVMLDLSNGKRMTPQFQAGSTKVIVPNSGSRKLCVMASLNAIRNITQMTAVNSTGYFNNFKTKNLNKPYVIVYGNALRSSASAYISYRQSAAGGSYQVIGADASELYMQFSYGVNQHPLAIRNFIRYLNDSLTLAPKYVLLIGHGVRPDEASYNGSYYTGNILPGFGVPASDYLYTSAFGDTNYYVPKIPIGRIAALSNGEVNNYLVKVKQHESDTTAAWKKNVLHFVGGDEPNLVKTLTEYMNSYESIITNTLFGANVSTYKKNTTAPIQTNISDSVFNRIKDGCSIITFFGHGSLSGFDQAIDNPSRYNNLGRYPLYIANSCNSGDIYFPTFRSISENMLFANQRGSIAFVATTTFGFDYYLYQYTVRFYRALAATSYNKGYGDAVKETMSQCLTPDSRLRLVALDMSSHGDPALVFAPGALPDYEINNSDISFDLQKSPDSIGIDIKIKNIGAARQGSFAVRVARYLSSGDSIFYFKTIDAPYSQNRLNFYFHKDMLKGTGYNRFNVTVDYFNAFAEKKKTNNSTVGTVDLFVPGGDIFPVYPYHHAIVPKTPSLALKASTGDPFSQSGRYIFQLDTSDAFSTPLQSATLTSSGGVVEWMVSLPYADSTVYYWRVSRDSSGLNAYNWKERSFQTIGNKKGWGQAHFYQFKNNQYQYVSHNKAQRKFIFYNTTQHISCYNYSYPYHAPEKIGFYFNTIRRSNWGCAPGGFNIVLFDTISGEPVTVFKNPPNGVLNPDSSCICVNSLPYYTFSRNTYCTGRLIHSWQSNFEKFINDIPVNTQVLLFTVGRQNNFYSEKSSFSNSLYNAIESLGAGIYRDITDTVPYILFGRKGMSKGQGHEIAAKNERREILLTDSIKTRWNNGYVASPKIGPAGKWQSLHWRVKNIDPKPGDYSLLKLVGYYASGQADTIVTFPTDSADILNLSDYVDAREFAYLQLVAYLKDNVHNTPAQLTRWQVIYDEVPECAINPLKGFKSLNDTLLEGDQVTFHFPVENIGEKNFTGTLAIRYWIEDQQRNRVALPDKLYNGPFTPGQVIIDTLKVNSYQLKGSNGLWVNVNPIDHALHQTEQYYFNNIGRYPFKVNGDITNPLLDVTFDGVRILNGDIVSSRPSILISLKDENKFLAINDTSAFNVFVQRPGVSTLEPVYFAQGLVFTPASLPKNSCSIEYRPVLVQDGKYTLVVQARDRSNNVAGKQDYRVQFEVNNQPGITGVLNYPNPFSSSTRFVFTLTGSEIPEVFTIQILTISGKVVREITRAELGYLHIGRNITEYAWDGRDNYGDKLGNGVYLYRVITRLNGRELEKNSSGADRFIMKDFGKMVIMR